MIRSLLYLSLLAAWVAALVLTLQGCAHAPPAPREEGQRSAQRIARGLASCLALARENWEALRCECAAQESCLRAGLHRLCGYDDLVLEARGSPGVFAGRCAQDFP